MVQTTMPWRALTEQSEVTFGQLAEEAMDVAQEGTGFGATNLSTRFIFWSISRELRHAERWGYLANHSLWYRTWHLGILHYGFWIFVPLALAALVRSLLLPLDVDAAGLLATLGTLGLFAASFGCLIAGSKFGGLESDVKWAERYRESRLAVEWQLRSDAGHLGWKLARCEDGGWVLTPAAPTTDRE